MGNWSKLQKSQSHLPAKVKFHLGAETSSSPKPLSQPGLRSFRSPLKHLSPFLVQLNCLLAHQLKASKLPQESRVVANKHVRPAPCPCLSSFCGPQDKVQSLDVSALAPLPLQGPPSLSFLWDPGWVSPMMPSYPPLLSVALFFSSCMTTINCVTAILASHYELLGFHLESCLYSKLAGLFGW